jgi:hypothetical protein
MCAAIIFDDVGVVVEDTWDVINVRNKQETEDFSAAVMSSVTSELTVATRVASGMLHGNLGQRHHVSKCRRVLLIPHFQYKSRPMQWCWSSGCVSCSDRVRVLVSVPRLGCCLERHKCITATTATRLLPHDRELSHQVCWFVMFALPHLSHIWFSAPNSNLEPFFCSFLTTAASIFLEHQHHIRVRSSSCYLQTHSISQTRPIQISIMASNSITWD